MDKKIQQVKYRLLELGFLDNEWLEKYLEILASNLTTLRDKRSTQAHHAIPVNAYWKSNESYNRAEALKLAEQDPTNFVVNLLYKDHLLIHSFLTLCTDLSAVQTRYETQANLRIVNSKKANKVKNQLIMPMPKYITEETILSKLEFYETKLSKATSEKEAHGLRCSVAQWRSKYRQYLENPEKYKKPEPVESTVNLCHTNAKRREALKLQLKQTHETYTKLRTELGFAAIDTQAARAAWKCAIEAYKAFELEIKK